MRGNHFREVKKMELPLHIIKRHRIDSHNQIFLNLDIELKFQKISKNRYNEVIFVDKIDTMKYNIIVTREQQERRK